MILGVDTASVDGSVGDWPKAKIQVPLGFAFLRCEYGDKEDSAFAREWKGAHAVSLPCGAYGFLRHPRNGHAVPSPTDQAQAMIATLDSVNFTPGVDFPPTLDVEFPGAGASETGLSTAELIARVLEAWQVLRDHYGVPPILYTSERVWREDLHNISAGPMVASPLWLAKYPFAAGHFGVRDAATVNAIAWPPLPKPWLAAASAGGWVHQYQGDAVQVPGFSAAVDLNRFNVPLHGEQSPRIGWIQEQLGVTVTGIFDDATVEAVKNFQAVNGLSADAIIGPKTFVKLCWAKAQLKG